VTFRTLHGCHNTAESDVLCMSAKNERVGARHEWVRRTSYEHR